MRLLYKAVIVLLAIVTAYCEMSPRNEAHCNCDYCDKETEKANENASGLYKEDADDDGNRTICARDRDFNDRTFPSVCHMLCYNRCLILRLSAVRETDRDQYVVYAYRNNYYKLRDGECWRRCFAIPCSTTTADMTVAMGVNVFKVSGFCTIQ